MTQTSVTFLGGPIFDGETIHKGRAARFENGVLAALVSQDELGTLTDAVDLSGALLSPGFVDLQVNGGGGVMLNDAPSVATLSEISAAHRGLGTVRILPTLITDRPEVTGTTIGAVQDAITDGVPGILGLHLEGPHLSLAKKGAHDPALIRRMDETDLAIILGASRALPVLMVTIAPENVSLEQVEAMASAGVIVSLGHTDAAYETCHAYVRAGARCATHLFNAMSPLASRAPGLVGAALSEGTMSCGLIADGIHVHPAMIHTAWAAKRGPGEIFLVSDAMAVAGTELTEFSLGGRRIMRHDGRLSLEDGTLAGADLDLARAVKTMHHGVDIPLDAALRAATTAPAQFVGLKTGLRVGETRLADVIRIAPDLGHARPLTVA